MHGRSGPAIKQFSLSLSSHSRKQSLTTKIWAMAVRIVAGPFHPGLYSYQNSLPRLPVPSLEGTCRRVSPYLINVIIVHSIALLINFFQYLDSVRPLLNDKDYEEMVRLVKDFKVMLQW